VPRKRIRGQALRLQLDPTSQYNLVTETRAQQRYLSAEDKIRFNISLNIYDAARSYREEQGLESTPIRTILKDKRFRNAWGTFKGGYKYDENDHTTRLYKKKGGIASSTQQKMDAAKVLGWYDSKRDALDRLRNVSP
jgi:hypothetical protein